MSQNPLQKIVRNAPLPGSTRAFNAYSHSARAEDRRRFNGGLGRGTPRSVSSILPAVVGDAIAGAKYNITVGRWAGNMPAAGDAVWDAVTDFDNPIDAILLNQPEIGRPGVHRTDSGSKVFVEDTGETADNGRPVYVINYSYAIRKARYNQSTLTLEVSYADKDNYVDADFVPVVTFTQCTGTPTPQLMQYMGF